MRSKKLTKLKYTIWFYFVIFSLVFIAIIWIFQILFLDMQYQNKKFKALSYTGNDIAVDMNTDEPITSIIVDGWLSAAIDANELGIFSYVIHYNAKGELCIESVVSAYADFHDYTTYSQISYITNSNNSNDTDINLSNEMVSASSENVILLVENAITILEQTGEQFICDKESIVFNDGCFYFITKIKNETINGYLMLLSPLSTLNDTIKIVQTHLIIESAAVVIVGFLISLYLATKLSKPIDEMASTAKQWANGNNNVTFDAKDIRELAELADALNYAKKGIAQTSVLQKDLLANVSHDLKTPLTMIKGYASMLRDFGSMDKEKSSVYTKVIIEETDRLTLLVNDILKLSKLQSGMSTLNLEPVNLTELLDTVLFRIKEYAEKNGFIILTDIEDDLISVCDEAKIEQVFYNLIGNSLNYTGSDKTISVRLKRNDDIVLFETIDSGQGISDEELPFIWEKYYRSADTHQRPINGTGLGLSIVKTVLESHKVKFGVISEKGVGSNFFVEFAAYDE